MTLKSLEELQKTSHLSGGNAAWIEAWYEDWLEDPNSVPGNWARVFENLAGGAEASVCPLGIGGFCAMKALSTRNDDPQRASRPFDRERDGFVIGEGAGVFVV